MSFHNDPVAKMGSLPIIENPNKAYTRNTVGEINDYDAISADFHDFTYYMGEMFLINIMQMLASIVLV